jgi:predicted HTH domain antitoxin
MSKQKDNEEMIRHQTLLQGHQKGLYIASTGLFKDNNEVLEFGKTDDLRQRSKNKTKFPKWLLKFFCKSENSVQLERDFKANKEISKRRIKIDEYGTELLVVDDLYNAEKYNEIAVKLSKALQNTELEIEKQKTEQLRLQIELEKLKRS